MSSQFGTNAWALIFAVAFGLQGPSMAFAQTVTTQSINNGTQTTTITNTPNYGGVAGVNAQNVTTVTTTTNQPQYNYWPVVIAAGAPLLIGLIGPMLSGGGLFGGGGGKNKSNGNGGSNSATSPQGAQNVGGTGGTDGQNDSPPADTQPPPPEAPSALADQVPAINANPGADASTLPPADSSGSVKSQLSSVTKGAREASAVFPAMCTDKEKRDGKCKVPDTVTCESEYSNQKPSGNPLVNLGACGRIPANVQKAKQEALSYRDQCGSKNSKIFSADGKVVITDYSETNGIPVMYIFSHDGSECKGKIATTFGNSGQHADPTDSNTCGPDSMRPLACSTGSSNSSPPGMHVTEVLNDDGTIKGSSFCYALGLVGLEGQGSKGRTIRIHGTTADGAGRACSEGCTGVYDIKKVNELIGGGSLVYNYFGDNPAKDPKCTSNSGLGAHDGASCRRDDAGSSQRGLASPADAVGAVK